VDRHPLPIHPEGTDGWSRRSFLLGVAALAGCRPPREKILPYARQPPEVQPGRPLFYATSMAIEGNAIGLLVESHEGRPTKIEGNPEHPASLGATGLQHQAAILDLYDPARARLFRRAAGPAGWGAFVERFGPTAQLGAGEGLHVVLEPTASPLLASLIERIRARLPAARFHFHAPLATGAVEEGSRRAFGQVLATQRRYDRARVVLAIDADFLASGPNHVREARDFAAARRVRDAAAPMNRLYVVESELTCTGAVADHRLRARPSDVPRIFAGIAAAILGRPSGLEGRARRFAEAVATDLLRHPGAGVVVVGDRQPAAAHALAHVLDERLGNRNATVFQTAPTILEAGGPSHGLASLRDALTRGEVRTLLLLEVDPAYDAELGEAIAMVPETVCLALHETETARACGWFIPALHWLEGWGDGRSHDGTLTLQQPLIRPLYGGRSPAAVLAVLAGEADPDPHRLLRALHGIADERAWERLLRTGFVPGTAFPPLPVAVRADAAQAALASLAREAAPAAIELCLAPDRRLRDGRFGRNDWLLELPDPITRIAWENPALLSPATARRLGVESGDPLEVRAGDRVVRAPAFVVQGTADDTVVLHLGWGHHHRGEGQVGVNAWPLRAAAGQPVEVRAAPGQRIPLASAQPHIEMHGRPILLHATVDAFRADPALAVHHDEPRPSLYPDAWRPSGVQWGMAIDLGVCTGCATCVIACQAENNVPVVGKVGVRKGREMHWLRIDRYLLGESEDDVRLLPQPMLCQHCEKAPCEYVCPVNATVHSADGLNEMVYNRCIGTRFCSNNCPYKVRRFNWLEYNEPIAATQAMQKNPDVTVRARGVMEKCTYCVQRIRAAQIDARLAGRALRDGDVQTACQAACPTGAIVFGPVSDPESAVSRLHRDGRSYGVLQHQLGTEPRTRYLVHLRNPNPELEA